jgi:hypothetical protein
VSAILASEPLLEPGEVLVETAPGMAGGTQVSVLVPWPLNDRDAETTRAGVAALLLAAPADVLVLSDSIGAPRSLAETLRAVAAAIREARG